MSDDLLSLLLELEFLLSVEAELENMRSESQQSSIKLSHIINQMTEEQVEFAKLAYAGLHNYFNELTSGMNLGVIQAFLVGYSLGINQKK